MAGGKEGRPAGRGGTVHVRIYARTKGELDKLARKGETYAKVIEDAVALLASKGRRA